MYFWRTLLFFQACFCHYHSWSSSCLKSAGRRTAQPARCAQSGTCTARWGKQAPSSCQRRRRRRKRQKKKRGAGGRRERKKGRGSQRARWELRDLDPNSVWLVFISTSRCCAISQFSLSRPWSVCGTVFMSSERSAGDKSRGGEAVRRSKEAAVRERRTFLSLPLLELHIISNHDPILLSAASLFGLKLFWVGKERQQVTWQKSNNWQA